MSGEEGEDLDPLVVEPPGLEEGIPDPRDHQLRKTGSRGLGRENEVRLRKLQVGQGLRTNTLGQLKDLSE